MKHSWTPLDSSLISYLSTELFNIYWMCEMLNVGAHEVE